MTCLPAAVPRPLLLALAAVALVSACGEAPLFTEPPEGAVLAKGGPKAVPPPTYAHIAWDDAFTVEVDDQVVPAGIIGDGRQADGSPGPSAVQGNVCGVNAEILNGANGSGDMIFDEYTATTCGAGRVHFFYLDGPDGQPTQIATKTIARDLWSMAVGETRTDQFEGFHVGATNCERIVFDAQYAGISNPRRTRTDDGSGPRAWRVESQLPHKAVCVYTARGKQRVGATVGPIPFAFEITEVK